MKKGCSMTKEQIQIEINKTNRKLANVQAEIRKQKRSIEDNEHKLNKLKQSLDSALNNYQVFDKVNNSLESLTELRFVKTWVNSRSELNSSNKRKAALDMDNSYQEQKRVVVNSHKTLNELSNKESQYKKKLITLKQQLKNIP